MIRYALPVRPILGDQTIYTQISELCPVARSYVVSNFVLLRSHIPFFSLQLVANR
jgi:hypothetical protein